MAGSALALTKHIGSMAKALIVKLTKNTATENEKFHNRISGQLQNSITASR
jgi:hypothetical protein